MTGRRDPEREVGRAPYEIDIAHGRDHLERDLGELLAQRDRERREHRLRDARRCGDPDRALRRSLAALGGALGSGGRVRHLTRGLEQALAEARSHGAIDPALEQWLAELRLELREAAARGRLGHPQRACGAAQAPAFGDREDELEVAPLHMHFRMVPCLFPQFYY